MSEKLQDKIDYYLEWCYEIRDMSAATIKTKKNILRLFLKVVGNKRFDKITNFDIGDFVKYCRHNGTRNNGINGYLSVIKAMFRFYLEMGESIKVKIPLIPKLKAEPHRRNYYPKEVVELVIESAGSYTAMLIRLSFETGMRISELTNLKMSDFEGRKIHYMGKGREWHDTWLKESTYQQFLEFVKIYNVENYLWYENNHDKPMTRNTLQKYMNAAFEKCGYYDFHPHALRHSFAYNLQRKGATPEEIQHMIGHKSVATTERYLHGFGQEEMKLLFEKYV